MDDLQSNFTSNPPEVGGEHKPDRRGIHVGPVRQSVISGSVHNAKDINFGGTGGSEGFAQSFVAEKVAIGGDVFFRTYNNYYQAGRGASSTPQGAFSRPELEFQAKQHEYFRISRISPSTGQWLLESEPFVDWRDGASRKLWAYGIPGAGKTILASIIVEHLQNRYTSSEYACLYVYFDYTTQRGQTYEKLLSSLLAQLLRFRPLVTEKVKSIHEDFATKHIPPGPYEYLSMLQSETRTFKRVYVVIDALDECLDDPKSNTMFNFVNALDQLPCTHILFTSRNTKKIREMIKPDRKIHIKAKPDDLRTYSRNRINELDGLKKLVKEGIRGDPQFLDKALDAIVKRSEGMFLLAKMHVNSLAEKQNLEGLEQGIEELPSEPMEVYAKAVDQIKNNQPKSRYDMAVRALTWLMYAERALSIDELIHALAVRPQDTKLNTGRFLTEEDITSACAGMVIVDPESMTVNLAHYTAKEYLPRAGIFENHQSFLAEVCLVYMSFDDFSTTLSSSRGRKDRLRQYPFLKYAADHWGDHVARRVRGDVHRRAWAFLNDTAKLRSAFQVMSDFPFDLEPQVIGLHIAAYFGLTRLVSKAIRMNEGQNLAVNARTRSGETALHWAAKYGQDEFLKLLVDNGADLNLADYERQQTALQYATANGDMLSVSALLKSNRHCDLCLQDSGGWNPLRRAAAYGHLNLVKALLDCGTDVDARDRDGWTALRWAAQRGHTRVAEILINRGAAVKVRSGSDRWNLLHSAAREGLTSLVELLIGRGVDPNETNTDETSAGETITDKWTALRWAVEYGHGKVAWLLLRGGADANLSDHRGFAPLHAAVEKWQPATEMRNEASSLLWLLLENRANVDAQTKDGRTALHIAASQGYTSVAWLLLENGATPTLRSNSGSTALHCAATEGHVDVAELLLTRKGGTDLVHVADLEGRTALHTASSSGGTVMVKLLLDSGAQIDAQDREGYTPLHLAVMQERLEVVVHLVKMGADVNAMASKRKKRWTALHEAVHVGNGEIVNALLESPDVNKSIRDSNGHTASHLARFMQRP